MTNALQNKKKEIEKRIKDLHIVYIEKLKTEKGQTLYKLKIGGIDVRVYLSDTEANRVTAYMTEAVAAAIFMYDTVKKTTEKIEV